MHAIRDVLREEAPYPAELPTQTSEVISSTAQAEIIDLAERYEQIRREMPSGGTRTRRMTEVFSSMKAKAARVVPLLPEFKQSASPGKRLAGIAILQMFPNVEHLDWLGQRLDPEVEKPFVGYQAAVALLEAARSLPVSECQKVRVALAEARELADRLKAIQTGCGFWSPPDRSCLGVVRVSSARSDNPGTNRSWANAQRNFCSKNQLERGLHVARKACTADYPEIRRSERASRSTERRRVGHIERFHPELYRYALDRSKLLVNR